MRFEGGQELAAALASLPARVSKRVVKEALTDAAEPMRASMARLAPRAPGAPDIADNIVVSAGRGGKDAFGDVRAQSVAVGPSRGFFYGYFLEWGTSKMSPRAFMRPAFDSTAPQVINEIAPRLWTELAGRGVSRTTSAPSAVTPGGSGVGL